MYTPIWSVCQVLLAKYQIFQAPTRTTCCFHVFRKLSDHLCREVVLTTSVERWFLQDVIYEAGAPPCRTANTRYTRSPLKLP